MEAGTLEESLNTQAATKRAEAAEGAVAQLKREREIEQIAIDGDRELLKAEMNAHIDAELKAVKIGGQVELARLNADKDGKVIAGLRQRVADLEARLKGLTYPAPATGDGWVDCGDGWSARVARCSHWVDTNPFARGRTFYNADVDLVNGRPQARSTPHFGLVGGVEQVDSHGTIWYHVYPDANPGPTQRGVQFDRAGILTVNGVAVGKVE
jgi:hypothetical protein